MPILHQDGRPKAELALPSVTLFYTILLGNRFCFDGCHCAPFPHEIDSRIALVVVLLLLLWLVLALKTLNASPSLAQGAFGRDVGIAGLTLQPPHRIYFGEKQRVAFTGENPVLVLGTGRGARAAPGPETKAKAVRSLADLHTTLREHGEQKAGFEHLFRGDRSTDRVQHRVDQAAEKIVAGSNQPFV